MNLRALLKQALARKSELQKIGGEREFTDEELKEAGELADNIKELREKIAKQDEIAAKLKGISDDAADADSDDDDSDDSGDDDDNDDQSTADAVKSGRRIAVRDRKSYGERFTKSDQFKAFKKAHPSGVGNGTPIDTGRIKVGSMADYFAGRKATLNVDLARIQPVRMPMVDLVDRNRLTLLDLIARGTTGGNFEYVQVQSVTRNAAIVAEGGLKPLSDFQTSIEDAKVYTYADGYDVTNQLLSDGPAFASYMDSELEYSIDNVIEELLLNGTGVNGVPRGLLNTTGVQEVDYAAGDVAGGEISPAAAMAFVKAARRGITRVTRRGVGGKVDAVLISPEMEEAIDLLQDANERFYGQGPFGAGPGTLWGRPRVTSDRLEIEQGILGDFKQIALLDREGLTVQAFNQHKDYAQRNMVYVRAELRAAQAIWKPNRLVVIGAEV
ncbi:phage major capsid protein [Rhodococcoides fascians]|uniref:phage major capsid protein n=1 Tax=Rhodococcoides fascians TaxID=1828 RepID=UPI00055E60F1|nr:phage major capsid protein [Rhodococcus fascians]